MAEVRVKSLHKAFPDGTVAVHDLDLTIADGELFVMLGPSGCGKTTTLRAIAGLERQTAGDIRIGDTLVNDLPVARVNSPVVITPEQVPMLRGVHELRITPVDPAGGPRPDPDRRQRAQEDAAPPAG